MSPAVLALVALVSQPPSSPLAPPPIGGGIDADEVLASLATDSQDEDRRSLYGHQFPNLVRIEDLAIIVHAGGLDAIRDRYEGPGTITVSGTLSSPFDSEVSGAEIKVAFFPADETKWSWHRLTSSPLTLTDEDLKTKLPRPKFSIAKPLLSEHAPSLRSSLDIRVETELDSLELVPRALPGYLATLTDYTLVNPTARDVAMIIERGGTTDLIALAAWAEDLDDESMPFRESDRALVMQTLGRRLRTLRAPPALGDLQRLNTMLLLVRRFADASDLEFLLGLDRAMRIMLTSAALSYYDALIEENFIELPIHGIQSLPASSREFMRAYRYALQDVRRKSLARLLELAHDPLDFRGAPNSNDLKRSPVQPQAKALLRPLVPTNVSGLLDAAEDDVAAQRDILRYYIRVHHAPVVEPLLRWLLEHPSEYERLGVLAAQELGSLIVPALLRYYFDPNSPEHKSLARELLLRLDEQTSAEVVEIIRSTGVVLPQRATIGQALGKFDEKQAGQLRRDAAELEGEAFDGAEDVLSLSARLQAIQRLGTISPDRLRRRSDDTIALLSKAAIALDTDSPAESARALSLLESLPLDRASIPQAEALAIAQARIAIGRREFDRGLKILEAYEGGADNPRIRQLYLDTVERRADMLINASDFARAHALLTRATARHEDAAVLIELSSRLFLAQYWPALVLAGLFGATVLGTGGWLTYRAVRKTAAGWRDARRRSARLRRREDHARRAAAELEKLANEATDGDGDAAVIALDASRNAEPPITSVLSPDDITQMAEAPTGALPLPSPVDEQAPKTQPDSDSSDGEPSVENEATASGGAEASSGAGESADDSGIADRTVTPDAPDRDADDPTSTPNGIDDHIITPNDGIDDHTITPNAPDNGAVDPTSTALPDGIVHDATIAPGAPDDNIDGRTITSDDDIDDRSVTPDDDLDDRTITSDNNLDDRSVTPDGNLDDRTITSDNNLDDRTITSDDNVDERTMTPDDATASSEPRGNDEVVLNADRAEPADSRNGTVNHEAEPVADDEELAQRTITLDANEVDDAANSVNADQPRATDPTTQLETSDESEVEHLPPDDDTRSDGSERATG